MVRDNPWLSDRKQLSKWYASHLPLQFIPRNLQLPVERRVILVVGPRQSGKSTLIWRDLAESNQPSLFLNCEELAIREWLDSPALFLADLEELSINASAILFDEIQHLDEAGLFLKGLVDRGTGMRLLATGSSSFDLEAKTRESLAGRAKRFRLLPLSLDEIIATIDVPDVLRQTRVENELLRMLVYGGYPEVVTSDQPADLLGDLVEAFVIRDASDRFRIRHVAAFRKLIELMASQIGNLCNYSEWASIAGVSNDTIREYAHLLEETHLVRLLKPYVGGKRAEIKSKPKVFFLDNGIRNRLFGGFSPPDQRADRGPLLENFVLSEIEKQISPLLNVVKYWRSKGGAEVDFVIEHEGQILPIEVKAGDARQRVSRSARTFIDAYRPQRLIIVNKTRHPPLRLGETEVCFIQAMNVGSTVHDWIRS